MTQTNKLVIAATLAALVTPLTGLAGDAKTIIEPAAPEQSITACDTLKNIGTLYKNSENPYIQEFKLFGRYQYQVGSISGNDVNGDNFNSNFSNHRRFRLGTQMKFANYFKLKANVNLVTDTTFVKPNSFIDSSLKWGIPDVASAVFDEAKLSFDAGKAFDIDELDALSFTYGRQKLKMSQEGHNSSKKIKTIERSSLANTVYRSARPVGFALDAAKGSWRGNVSIFSDQISDTEWGSVVGDWNAGLGYYASLTKSFDNSSELTFDFLYHDRDGTNDASMETGKVLDWFGYDWAASAAYTGTCGRWGYVANLIAGDHGDNGLSVTEDGVIKLKPERGGLFYGAILQGTYWISEGTLEAVAQYQWQGSKEYEGVRTNSRYFRADNGGDVNSGRGDSHHSLYAGLNWYLCGDNAKFMTGVEYQNLDTPDGDADATTLLLAYRMYF